MSTMMMMTTGRLTLSFVALSTFYSLVLLLATILRRQGDQASAKDIVKEGAHLLFADLRSQHSGVKLEHALDCLAHCAESGMVEDGALLTSVLEARMKNEPSVRNHFIYQLHAFRLDLAAKHNAQALRRGQLAVEAIESLLAASPTTPDKSFLTRLMTLASDGSHVKEVHKILQEELTLQIANAADERRDGNDIAPESELKRLVLSASASEVALNDIKHGDTDSAKTAASIAWQAFFSI